MAASAVVAPFLTPYYSGLALTAWIVKREGVDAIGEAIGAALPVLPLAMALANNKDIDGSRIDRDKAINSVMGANGSLVGYASGVKTKEFLLKLEGALMI